MVRVEEDRVSAAVIMYPGWCSCMLTRNMMSWSLPNFNFVLFQSVKVVLLDMIAMIGVRIAKRMEIAVVFGISRRLALLAMARHI